MTNSFPPIPQSRPALSNDTYAQYIESTHAQESKQTVSPLISWIIVAYRTGDKLIQCIRSCLSQGQMPSEVIVIDNELDATTRVAIQDLPIRYIKLHRNYGVSVARNIAALHALGNTLIFIDDDGIVDSQYGDHLLNLFQRSSLMGCRGKVLPKTKSNWMNRIAAHYNLGRKVFPCVINTEGNFAIRREIFIQIGGFDDGLFGHEGIVLSYRLHTQLDLPDDALQYQPDLILYHDYSVDNDHLKQKQARYHHLWQHLTIELPELDDFVRRYRVYLPMGRLLWNTILKKVTLFWLRLIN